MAWSQEISQLITEVDQLTAAVNVKKTVLETAANTAVVAANDATVAASASATSAGQAAGSAAQALAIYGSVEAQQTAVAVAQAQASLAAGFAASAASVAQQDLSGVTAQALHRSPNAITSMFIYDTSKDSDGGAWTERCQHTSWWNEAINGKWLGAQATEAAARAVSGATTGDYFQRTSDGLFYSLNAGSGITQVYRGNKRDFPRLAGIVAEGSNVTIYDLTEPGRPMWMRFVGAVGRPLYNQSVMGIAALNGMICASEANFGGLTQADFARDYAYLRSNSASEFNGAIIANRNAGASPDKVTGVTVALTNNTVNAVAMTVLPDAPVDPVTGLRVPTIAVATGSSLDVIKSDGKVVSTNISIFYGTNSTHPMFLQYGSILALRGGTGGQWLTFGLSDQNDTTPSTADAFPKVTDALFKGKMIKTGPLSTALVRAPWNADDKNGRVILTRYRDTAFTSGLQADVSHAFNTGWMAGDIRRCLLSDIEVGSVTGAELVSNGGFDTDSGWTKVGPGVSWSSGRYTIADVAGSDSFISQQIVGTKAGRTYRLTLNIVTNTTHFGAAGFRALLGNSAGATTPVVSWLDALTGTVTLDIPCQFDNAWLVLHVSATDRQVVIESASLSELVVDRSFRAKNASITGTITRAQLASGTSIVGYSGWSAANYLREPYSADLDFGTGEWTASAWVNVPVTLPADSFPAIGDAAAVAGWTNLSWDTFSTSGSSFTASKDVGGGSDLAISTNSFPVTLGNWYEITLEVTNAGAGDYTVGLAEGTNGRSTSASFSGSGTKKGFVQANARSGSFSISVGTSSLLGVSVASASIRAVDYATVFSRAAASGPRLRCAVTPGGALFAEASDGTTTRTVTTSAAYNTATWLKARVSYTTDGTLAILVNGREVAATRGAPLLTLNNASAVLTIGNSFALDAPFPGSIALLKLGATVPTPEQATFMFEQEKQLFRAGALSVLPDSGAIVDMAYDDATDRWVAMSATNESYWTGLVRNSVTPVPAGSYSRVATTSGIELTARTTTNPGVDVTIPPYGLREELVKRAEAAARLSHLIATYDYVGGFTGNITTGSTAITSVANLTYPTSYIGARISGAGISVNTFVTGVSGTTIYISAPASATTTGVSISFLDFILPVGQEAKVVMSAGTIRREGSTADYTRLYDGFKETIRFATAPGATTWVQIQSTRSPQ